MILLVLLCLFIYFICKTSSKSVDWVFEPLDSISISNIQTSNNTENSNIEAQKQTTYCEENVKENSDFRPKCFDEYIGQSDVKEALSDFIEASIIREEKFPHFLISGQAGTGKTLLAQIVANQLGVNFVETIASAIETPEILINKIRKTNGGILFIDELHAISREVAEACLYRTMEEFKDHAGRRVKKFTLAGCTTELGEILESRKPLYERFKLPIELETYKKQDLIKIVKQYKEKQYPNDILPHERLIYNKIGRNARGTPRKAIKYVDAVIRLNGDINKTFKFFKIIKNGFTLKDLEVLEYLAQNEKPVGLKGLVSYLGTSKANFEYSIEPYLVQKLAIQRTPRGRVITEKGKKYVKELKKELEKRK